MHRRQGVSPWNTHLCRPSRATSSTRWRTRPTTRHSRTLVRHWPLRGREKDDGSSGGEAGESPKSIWTTTVLLPTWDPIGLGQVRTGGDGWSKPAARQKHRRDHDWCPDPRSLRDRRSKGWDDQDADEVPPCNRPREERDIDRALMGPPTTVTPSPSPTGRPETPRERLPGLDVPVTRHSGNP